MTKRMFLAFCFGLCAVSAVPAYFDIGVSKRVTTEGKFYKKDYVSAAKNSRETGRKLVVLLSASWCGPCNQLKRDISEAASKGSLPDDCNIVVVDYSSEVGKKLCVSNSIPQLIRFEKWADGKWRKTVNIGYLSPNRFKEFCDGEK